MISIWDNNGTTIDGLNVFTLSEDIPRRYVGAIRKATAAEECTDRRALIRYKVIAGYGPHNTSSSHDAHDPYIVVHYTCYIIGDCCLQESTSHEAYACAGHLGLGRLTAFWTTAASCPRLD